MGSQRVRHDRTNINREKNKLSTGEQIVICSCCVILHYDEKENTASGNHRDESHRPRIERGQMRSLSPSLGRKPATMM